MEPATLRRRDPIWLVAGAVAAGWAALYTVVVWVLQFLTAPVHDDVRLYYVAAEAGIRYGWSTIYDQATLRSVSSSLPEATRFIDVKTTFASTPFMAWVFAPLTVFPEPVAYVLWTLLSLAAIVFAWRIAAPYRGLRKVTLLLLAIGLWPVLLTLYFGQPTLLVIASVAAAWWLSVQDRPLAAGVVLALATFLKPQAVLLLPAALLVSGRFRIVAGWAASCAVIGTATVINLGSTGLIGWWAAVKGIEGLHVHTLFTLAGPLGNGPLTDVLWAIQGLATLFVAWRRRSELEIVFGVGLLGTAATATYLHNSDYCFLILAAWFVLRTSPPIWHRVWLLLGVVPMQLLLTSLIAVPQLIYDAAWLALLVFSSFALGHKPSAVEALPTLHAKAVTPEVVMTARRTDEATRGIGL